MRAKMIMAIAFLAATPVQAGRALRTVQPLPHDLLSANHIVAVSVEVGEVARPAVTALDAKAAGKRTEAKLPPLDDASGRPTPTTYATLPLARMFPLVVDDKTRDWGLTGGRSVKLKISVDTLKTADAGMAILIGSADELAGIVTVSDADSGEKLGEFYVDVLNFRSGLLGLAMRGAGVREKLADEFAKHICEELSGRKSKSGPVKKS